MITTMDLGIWLKEKDSKFRQVFQWCGT